MNKQRLSDEEIVRRIKQKHGDTVTIDLSTYRNCTTKAKFIDKDYGEWWAQPGSVFHGSGHHKRFCVKQRLTLDEVKRRLAAVHGDTVTLIDSTYISTMRKCTFIDSEFGEWSAVVGNVLNKASTHPLRGTQKRKQTWVDLYGVDNPFKSDAVQTRAMSGRRKVHRIKHWVTSRELVCVGSYELAFVNWCNASHVDFDWQITHAMPDGRKYRIDAFIKTGEFADTWIEIKGYFRDDEAREKWDWFNASHPNSQLWDCHKLSDLNILVKKKPNTLYMLAQ